jgi:hypothetical protein
MINQLDPKGWVPSWAVKKLQKLMPSVMVGKVCDGCDCIEENSEIIFHVK